MRGGSTVTNAAASAPLPSGARSWARTRQPSFIGETSSSPRVTRAPTGTVTEKSNRRDSPGNRSNPSDTSIVASVSLDMSAMLPATRSGQYSSTTKWRGRTATGRSPAVAVTPPLTTSPARTTGVVSVTAILGRRPLPNREPSDAMRPTRPLRTCRFARIRGSIWLAAPGVTGWRWPGSPFPRGGKVRKGRPCSMDSAWRRFASRDYVVPPSSILPPCGRRPGGGGRSRGDRGRWG